MNYTSNVCKAEKLLITGYLNSIKKRCKFNKYIPTDIIQLIRIFYLCKCTLIGFGLAEEYEFGNFCNETPLKMYGNLDEAFNIVDHIDDIYIGQTQFIIKTMTNAIFHIGSIDTDYDVETASNENSDKNEDQHENKAYHKQFTQISLQHLFNTYHDYITIVSSGISCQHQYFMLKSGKLISYGLNNFGQCADGTKNSYLNEPKLLDMKLFFSNFGTRKNITQIGVGSYHTLFLTSAGNVYSCGDNRYGQCGRTMDENADVSYPTKVEHLSNDPIIQISIGSSHNLLLDCNSNLYGFGWNEDDQFGISDENVRRDIYYHAVKHPLFRSEKCICHEIIAGAYFSCVLTNDGECFMFGDNSCGMCGVSTTNNTHTRVYGYTICDPLRYTYHRKGRYPLSFIVNASLGNKHAFLLTNENELYGLGDNSHSEISILSEVDEISPGYLLTNEELGLMEHQKILRVICGFNTTLIIASL